MRISDWSSDVCSSDLTARARDQPLELIDPRPVRDQPVVDQLLRIEAFGATEAFEPKLLEIACEPGEHQPFPGIARGNPRGVGLRPIEPEVMPPACEREREHDHVHAANRTSQVE